MVNQLDTQLLKETIHGLNLASNDPLDVNEVDKILNSVSSYKDTGTNESKKMDEDRFIKIRIGGKMCVYDLDFHVPMDSRNANEYFSYLTKKIEYEENGEIVTKLIYIYFLSGIRRRRATMDLTSHQVERRKIIITTYSLDFKLNLLILVVVNCF